MSRASPARRARKLAQKRRSSSIVQSVRLKDPKPRYEGVYVGGMADFEPYGGSEAVKPIAPGVRMHVSVAMELALPYAKEPGGAACNTLNRSDDT